MTLTRLLGFVLLPLSLFIATMLVRYYGIGGHVLTATLPWICAMLGIAVLFHGVTCLLVGRGPAQLPRWFAVTVFLFASLGLAFGLTVDYLLFFSSSGIAEPLAEWFGFSLIFAFVVFLPRLTTDGGGQGA